MAAGGAALLAEENFAGAVYVPQDRGWTKRADYKQDVQIEWELASLKASNLAVFWVPRLLLHMAAFTTNVEFGRITKEDELRRELGMGEKPFVLGYPEGTDKMSYLDHLARRAGRPVRHTLRATLQAAIALLPA